MAGLYPKSLQWEVRLHTEKFTCEGYCSRKARNGVYHVFIPVENCPVEWRDAGSWNEVVLFLPEDSKDIEWVREI